MQQQELPRKNRQNEDDGQRGYRDGRGQGAERDNASSDSLPLFKIESKYSWKTEVKSSDETVAFALNLS